MIEQVTVRSDGRRIYKPGTRVFVKVPGIWTHADLDEVQFAAARLGAIRSTWGTVDVFTGVATFAFEVMDPDAFETAIAHDPANLFVTSAHWSYDADPGIHRRARVSDALTIETTGKDRP